MSERITDSHRRIEPHKLRGHDAAGRVVRILKQVFDLGAHLRTELRHETMPLVNTHFLNDVCALVSGQAFENGSHPSRLELFENGSASPHRGLVAKLDAARERKHRNYRGRVGEI